MTPRKRRSALAVLTGKLLQSRTVWVALGQALVAVLGLLATQDAALQWVSVAAIAKSGLDVFLRSITKEPVGKGQP